MPNCRCENCEHETRWIVLRRYLETRRDPMAKLIAEHILGHMWGLEEPWPPGTAKSGEDSRPAARPMPPTNLVDIRPRVVRSDGDSSFSSAP